MKNNNRVLDILFVSFVFLFLVAFPFDLMIKEKFYVYLAQTVSRIFFVAFLLIYDRFKKLIGLSLFNFQRKDLLFIPFLFAAFCNFYYLLERNNGFNLVSDDLFVVRIFFQLSAAMSEELLFRCVIQNNVDSKNPLIKSLIASVIFALFHLIYFFSSFEVKSLIIPIYTFALGFLLGFIYEYGEKNFFYIAGYHFLFNLINQVVYVYLLKVEEDYLFYINGICVALLGMIYLFILYFSFKKTSKSPQR